MSALKTLSDLPVETQRDALASATRSLLPQPPSRGEDPRAKTSVELQNNLIKEIRNQLKLRPDDTSPAAQAKLLRFISETLSSLILGNTNIHEIKARLGQRGDLAPKDYTIKYPKDFQNFQRAFAIRPNHVAETLRNPNHVQHLTPPEGDPRLGKLPNISFYSTMHLTREGKAFSLVVQTTRTQDIQQVYSAWRIYHTDVAMPDTYSPLGIFRALVDKYGKEITVASKPVGRLLLYDVLADVTEEQWDNARAPDDTGITTYQSLTVWNPTTRQLYVTLAYAIDVIAYCTALRRHGVDVHPESIKFGEFGKHSERKEHKVPAT